MPFDVITFGSGTRDIFVRSDAFETQEMPGGHHEMAGCFPLGAKIDVQEMVFETGGGATNAAATFGNLSWKTGVVCSVGDDSVGEELARAMKQVGVSTALFQKQPRLGTGVSVIILSGSGERTILVRRGASLGIKANKIPWSRLKAKWFYMSSFGGDIQLAKKILLHADKVGARVAWNPGNKELALGLTKLAPLIKMADIFNLNKEEAAALAGMPPSDLENVSQALRSLPRRALIITDGQAGAYAYDKESSWHSEIIDAPRVNVTGAGDAFGSGLVAGLMKKDDLNYALAVGTWNATGCVQKTGAKVGLLEKYPSDSKVKAVKISKLS